MEVDPLDVFGVDSADSELNKSSPQSAWPRAFSGSWVEAGGFWSLIDSILGDSLALAARALYCSHSTEPEYGALLLLATAEASVSYTHLTLPTKRIV